MTLEDVAGCVEDAKTSADRVPLELAEAEHTRTTLALSQQREQTLSARPDTESKITDSKRALKKRELHLSALHSRQRSTDAALSSATAQNQTFLKGLKLVVM